MLAWVSVLVALLAFAFPPDRANAELFTQEKCSVCHILESRFMGADPARTAHLKAEGEKRVCFSCHNGTVRDDRDTLWRGSQHPPLSGKKGPCSACHSPHGPGGWKVLAGTRIPLHGGGNALCLSCHKSHDPAKGSIHRTGFPESGCQVCHRAHGGAGNFLLKGAEEELCLRCHIAMNSALRGGHSWKTAPGREAGPAPPPCTSCHPVHKPGPKSGSPSALCGRCHPRYLSPAVKGSRVHPGVAECLTCHTVHARLDEKGRAFRGADMRPDLLCGKCHAGEVADTKEKGRERGTHVSAAGDKPICFRCHRIHSPVAGASLLDSDKPYFCLECHQEQNAILQTGGVVLAHPVFEHVGQGRLAEASKKYRILLGPKGELVCRTCHTLHRSEPGSPLYPKGTRGEESCLWCHEGMARKEHRSAPEGKINASCNDCHATHGQRVKGPADPGSRETELWDRVCQKCHDRRSGHVTGRGNRTTSRGKGMPAFDALGRRADATGGISCPTCHDPHGSPKEGKRLRKPYAQSGFLCTSCHGKEETIALTPHDHRGVAGNNVCEPCHVPHGGSSPWMWGFPRGSGEPAEEACRKCHDGKGMGTPIPKGGHSTNMIPSRPLPERFPLIGPGGDLSRKGVVSCPTCHEVHGTGKIPTGQGTGKLLRTPTEGEVDSLCTACHEGKEDRHGKANCRTCHAPHVDAAVEKKCGTCHADRPGALLSRHLEAGKGCRSCHRLHGGLARGSKGEGKGKGPEDGCYACHPATRKIEGTPHAETGKSSCDACHPVHGDPPEFKKKPKLGEEIFAPDLPCLRCHREGGEASLPPRAKHPNRTKEVATNYGAKVIFEIPITMTGRFKEGNRPLFPLFDDKGNYALSGRMGCLTCHDPHAGGTRDGSPSANGYLRDPGFVFLSDMCAPCHRGENADKGRNFHKMPGSIR